MASAEDATSSVFGAFVLRIGVDTWASSAANKLASRRSASSLGSSHRSHAAERPHDQVATAVVLPKAAAPITKVIRRFAARSNSSSTDGRLIRSSTDQGGFGSANGATLLTTPCLVFLTQPELGPVNVAGQ